MSIVGRTYMERGEPVEVLAQWRLKGDVPGAHPDFGWDRPGPRNVLVRRPNGDLVVRPFRGLRKPKATA